MTDDEQLQEIRESMQLYEGRTAKDRWLTACAAFLNLRHRVLTKWEGDLHQERSPDQDYWLCYSLRNLSVDNDVHLLERNPGDDWDEVMDLCIQLREWYAQELREFRVLTFRVYSTFAPFRRRLTARQQDQLHRCFFYFDYGEDPRENSRA